MQFEALNIKKLFGKINGQEMSPEEAENFKILRKIIKVEESLADIPIELQSAIARIFSFPEKTYVICDKETVDLPKDKQEKRGVVTAKNLESELPSIHSIVQRDLPESNTQEKLIENQSKLTDDILSVYLEMETKPLYFGQELWQTPRLNKYGGIKDISEFVGGTDELQNLIAGLQSSIYDERIAA